MLNDDLFMPIYGQKINVTENQLDFIQTHLFIEFIVKVKSLDK